MKKNISNYQLGIIWSIGSYVSDNKNTDKRFIFRHKDRYFLEQLESLFNNKISTRKKKIGNRIGIQYILRTGSLNINDLIDIGYSFRNANQRDIPVLDNCDSYKDFLRAYFEIHSTLSWQTKYVRKSKKNKKIKNKYYRLRLRIFGNRIIMESINNILVENRIIESKSIQGVGCNNGKTSYIQITSVEELGNIFNWFDKMDCMCVDGNYNYRYDNFWNEYKELLRKPVKECMDERQI